MLIERIPNRHSSIKTERPWRSKRFVWTLLQTYIQKNNNNSEQRETKHIKALYTKIGEKENERGAII